MPKSSKDKMLAKMKANSKPPSSINIPTTIISSTPVAGAEGGKEVAPVYTCEKESSEAIDSMPSRAVYVELSKRKSIVDVTGTAQKESRQISTGNSSLSQRAKEYALLYD